jgi:3-deoxy-7-phosphoheptulonate synthase
MPAGSNPTTPTTREAESRAVTTSDLRITHVRPLIAPAVLMEELPLTPAAEAFVAASRRAVEAVLDGRDARVLLVVGPCSIHDPGAALAYADRLRGLAERVREKLLVVMRVYF